jgi:hypothetical protein
MMVFSLGLFCRPKILKRLSFLYSHFPPSKSAVNDPSIRELLRFQLLQLFLLSFFFLFSVDYCVLCDSIFYIDVTVTL